MELDRATQEDSQAAKFKMTSGCWNIAINFTASTYYILWSTTEIFGLLTVVLIFVYLVLLPTKTE